MERKSRSTILILGDSTSMSIGVEQKTHPFILANRNMWPENTRILNCSLPGMTAADAAAFFFRHKKDFIKELSAVFIYLGNCDTNATEVRKGRYSQWRYLRSKFNEAIGKVPAKTSIKNRLLHFEWNNQYNPKIESPEDPSDYEHNIRLILSQCKSYGVPSILVRPQANLFFLSGIGKGNFVFYKYLGVEDRIADRISIPDQRFKQALMYQEDGDYEKAAEIYKTILVTPPASPMSMEYSLLVMNNYAAAKAQSGDLDEAEYLLGLLLKEQGVRREIVLYNLARISKMRADEVQYRERVVESYEADESLYRVRQPYVDAIDRITSDFTSTRVVNMKELIPESLYLDHCHPLPAGQVILADNIGEHYAGLNIQGESKAEIENILYNPELATGNISDFHEYFKTFAPLSQTQVEDELNALNRIFNDRAPYNTDNSELGRISREVKTAIEYHLRHPIFTSVTDIVKSQPVKPSDVGRFPEYFIIRHLIPYQRLIEDSMPEVSSQFNSDLKLLRNSSELMMILPEKARQYVKEGYPAFDTQFESDRLPAILAKVKSLLYDHLSKGNQVFERAKTTIFWYVRETLRFGSHSRYSMRYDRLLMEFLAEGLAVSAVLDNKLSGKYKQEIAQLIGSLEETVKIHDAYCSKFSLKDESKSLLQEYDERLKSVLHSMNQN